MKQLNRITLGNTGRLHSRPKQPADKGAPGLHPLRLDNERDGLIYVPQNYHAGDSMPLILMLHGARGNAANGFYLLQHLAEQFQMVLLAVDSRQQTWDLLVNGYGPDVVFIDRALAQIFADYTIDPNRLAIAGFSDGASYALSLGIANGDLFSHVIAFSPGFMMPLGQLGTPRFYIAHGKDDKILPIERCSRQIVPLLRQTGYEIVYEEFNGSHTVPEKIARAAVEWFVGNSTE